MAGPHIDEPTPDVPAGRDGGRPPATVLGVVGVVAVEVLALVVFAAAVLVELLRGASSSTGVSLFVIAFFGGLAWLLVASARALWHGRRGGRAPVAGWQVFQGLIGIALLAGGTAWAVTSGVVLLLLAGGVLVGLMTRPVVEHTVQ